ncbi:hypothetical protein, partial [Flavobacterium sp.]
MKKQFIAALALLISYAATAQSTPEKKVSKLELQIIGKLGFARLKQTGAVPLNGNINGSDILLAYKIGQRWDMAAGVGLLQFDANPTIAGNTASLRNSYLHIPLQFNGNYILFNGDQAKDPKLFFTIGAGLYANTLLKQELETVTGNTDTKNLGWNFGLSTQVGIKFLLSDALNIALGMESQGDLTKMKKDGAEQRIENLNAFY